MQINDRVIADACAALGRGEWLARWEIFSPAQRSREASRQEIQPPDLTLGFSAQSEVAAHAVRQGWRKIDVDLETGEDITSGPGQPPQPPHQGRTNLNPEQPGSSRWVYAVLLVLSLMFVGALVMLTLSN